MKKFLLLFPLLMLSCEKGASPYKDADKVSGSIKEISFKREIPCEDGYMGCYDYTVCEENKVEKTFTDDVEICVEIVEGPVIAKSDYINLQFNIDLPEDISDEFLYPIDDILCSNCEVSNEEAKINQVFFYYYDDKYHYIECMSKSDGLLYEPDMVNENGECVESGNYRARVKKQVVYLYADRNVNIKADSWEVKLKKGWNRTVWDLQLKFSEEWCQYWLSYSISTDNIPSDCEWVIIDNNENKR